MSLLSLSIERTIECMRGHPLNVYRSQRSA